MSTAQAANYLAEVAVFSTTMVFLGGLQWRRVRATVEAATR